MTPEQLKFAWEVDLNYGQQGSIEGLIWQKPDGKWIIYFADPNYSGRIIPCEIDYNPFDGQLLTNKVQKYEE